MIYALRITRLQVLVAPNVKLSNSIIAKDINFSVNYIQLMMIWKLLISLSDLIVSRINFEERVLLFLSNFIPSLFSSDNRSRHFKYHFIALNLRSHLLLFITEQILYFFLILELRINPIILKPFKWLRWRLSQFVLVSFLLINQVTSRICRG